jgi:prevent-host-death family protein
MKATAKDLRIHAKRLLDAVERGEEVLITYRGEPRARLIPAGTPEGKERRPTSLFGLWKDRPETSDVESYLDHLRQGRF